MNYEYLLLFFFSYNVCIIGIFYFLPNPILSWDQENSQLHKVPFSSPKYNDSKLLGVKLQRTFLLAQVIYTMISSSFTVPFNQFHPLIIPYKEHLPTMPERLNFQE